MNISARRKGHTLLELIAVVAILVVVAAIAMPMVKPMLGQRDNQAAVDLVQARFSKLRSKAVAEGQPYCFEYQQNTGKFRCVPDMDEGADEDDHWEEIGALPGDVKFTLEHSDNPPSKGGWTKVASFLPDNTAKQYFNKLQFGNDPVVLHGATKVESK